MADMAAASAAAIFHRSLQGASCDPYNLKPPAIHTQPEDQKSKAQDHFAPARKC